MFGGEFGVPRCWGTCEFDLVSEPRKEDELRRSLQAVTKEKHVIKADFSNFSLSLFFPPHFSLHVYYGSKDAFMGWRSTVYGKWEPIHSIAFVSELQRNDAYTIGLKIIEPESSTIEVEQ